MTVGSNRGSYSIIRVFDGDEGNASTGRGLPSSVTIPDTGSRLASRTAAAMAATGEQRQEYQQTATESANRFEHLNHPHKSQSLPRGYPSLGKRRVSTSAC